MAFRKQCFMREMSQSFNLEETNIKYCFNCCLLTNSGTDLMAKAGVSH